MNVVGTRALTRSCGSTRAQHDRTLAIPDGHVVALLGPNSDGMPERGSSGWVSDIRIFPESTYP